MTMRMKPLSVLREAEKKNRRILALWSSCMALGCPRKVNPNLVKPLGLVFYHLEQNMILID